MGRVSLSCFIWLLVLCIHHLGSVSGHNVIFAVNAGGPEHVDVFGIHYASDQNNNEGISSNFGMRYHIKLAHPNDNILYQTERYAHTNFGYNIPIPPKNNKYVLVLKFCEVYFQSPGAKVFDVILNHKHRIAENLDIFKATGPVTAYDIAVEFEVTKNGKALVVHGVESSIKNGKIRLTLAKGLADNPKINAFYVMQGGLNDIPRLPEDFFDPDIDIDTDEDAEEDDVMFDSPQVKRPVFTRSHENGRIRSGPLHMDPWELTSEISKYFPVGVVMMTGFVCYGFVSIFLKL